MSWPAPTRADHDKFCRTEGRTKVRDATGRSGTHHITYELALSDGRIVRTRISHPPDRSTYGVSMWAHILRDQLEVDEATFWAAVRDGVKPPRTPSPPSVGEALPAEVAFLLVDRVGLNREQVAVMSKEEAIQRLNAFWAEGQ
jgi:hypothetical protein